MKTKALKISLVSGCLALTMAACSSSNRNADQEGDTTMTDTANNTQVEGTDTMNTDTSTTGTAPGGAVGPGGQGSSMDTTAGSSAPAR